MTALALILQDMGKKVCGSDLEEEFVTDEILKRRGIKFFEGFDEGHVDKNIDLAVTSGAVGEDNPEIKKLRNLGIRILTHAQALQKLAGGKKVISVAGVGGKTTTTAMIAKILKEAEWDPSFSVGSGEIFDLGDPGHWGKGEYFVLEGDEYVNWKGVDDTARFLFQEPKIAVITNIFWDHPDVYKTEKETLEAFSKFANQTKSLLIVNGDDRLCQKMLKKYPGRFLTFGTKEGCDYQISNFKFQMTNEFQISNDKRIREFKLGVFGRHNVYNAAAAIAVADYLKIPDEIIAKALRHFRGVERRLQFKGEKNGVLFYDDYAHHPHEIKAALSALKEKFSDKKIICIFQAHTFSRTLVLLSDFGKAFGDCDQVLILPIFSSAREKGDKEKIGKLLASEIAKNHPKVRFCQNFPEVKSNLAKLAPYTLVVTMGAGDVYKVIKLA